MDNRDHTGSEKRHTAMGLFLTLLAIVFLTDILTNIITAIFHIPIILESVLGGFLVISIAYPALYLLIFKPLSVEIARRKRVEKMKDEFIGTVSHELRTPLSITKEGLSLVLDKIPGPLNEQQARILTVSKNNINRLSRIINDLLDISKIDAGKKVVRHEAFDIIPVIWQTMALFQARIRDKGLAFRSVLPKGAIVVRGDVDAIIQVLTNLIGNALKFTERGSIDISLKDTPEEIELSVHDTGVGISKEDMPKLFEKFQQFGRVNGPGEKGTGLGLAIAKGIITAHNGRIWAESEFGKGTKITFVLPKNKE
ncbi:MAG: HAMP domain-containing sensor histidine kinase [Candidatus Omnitrophica bacterium]|nr:HAMP domain-containing sensor histidine kinase [Candidatus Omnitrophota bacterium]